MPHINVILHDKENMIAPVKSPGKDSKQDVITDMLDCDGKKRIAIIIHTKSGPKHTLRKLFSPLTSRSTHSYNNHGRSVSSSDEKLPNNKRSRDSDNTSVYVTNKKQKKNAQEALAKLMKKAILIDTVEEDSNIYDSCPEIVNKVRHSLFQFMNYENILQMLLS